MFYNDLLTKLIYTTKKNNITNADIGKAINLDRQAMSGRASRNSKFKDNEIKQIERYFNVDLSQAYIFENTLERVFNKTIQNKNIVFSERLNKLKIKNNLSDFQMAGLLNISEQDYNKLMNNDITPDLKLIDNIKQNFKISVDWLLYSEE